jgi:hypothetical protein
MLFTLKILFTLLQNKLPQNKVNCTEPFPSIRLPWIRLCVIPVADPRGEQLEVTLLGYYMAILANIINAITIYG